MFGKLLKFEMQLHTRQVGFWVTMAVMLLMGILFMSSDEFVGALDTGEKIKSNGALAIGFQAASMSMFSLFFAAVFIVSGVMRDDEHKALELIHSTPVKTRDITYARTFGVFVITFICLMTFMLGLFVGQFAPWVDKETLGPVNLLYFIQPSIIYLAINALLISTLLSIVAYLTRKKFLVYVAAVAIFIIYTMSGELINENSPDLLASLLDPFGMRPLSIDTEFWPAAEMNVKMVPLDGYAGLNRLLYGLSAIGLFFGANRLFQRGILKSKTKNKLVDDSPSVEKIVLKSAPTNQSIFATLKSIGSRFKYEYLTTIKSIPFLILTGLAIMLAIFYIFVRSQIIPVAILPTSQTLALLSVIGLLFPMLIIIIFFSSEILWRERVAKFNEIIDATAVRNITLMTGKWLALIAVLITLFVIVNICAMIVQTIIGDIPINFGTYAKLTFLSFAPQLLLITILTMFVQNFIPNRILGMVISAGLIAFFILILDNLSFSHPLMSFGDLSPGNYSEMSGFSDWNGFKWFGALWVSLCCIFAAISVLIWPRGTQTNFKTRLTNIKKHKPTGNMIFVGISTIAFLGLFGTMYKTLTLDEKFRTEKTQQKRAVSYEKLAKPLIPKEHAKIRSVEADVRFMPSKQEASVKGKYVIENTTSVPLEQLFINPPTDNTEDVKLMALEGANRDTDSKLSKDLDEYDIWIYKFSPPLAIGEKSELTFETFYHAPRLADGSAVAKNGTFVNNGQIFPTLGIPELFLRNNDTRRKYDLPKREKMPARDDMTARQSNFFDVNSDYVDFKATVCTDLEQIPIAPGKFLREYTEAGQNCRDYKAIRPITNFFSFLTAKYTVKEDIWKNSYGENVDLKIFYHKEHNYNVDLMMDAMKSSFDTFTEKYGPYQHEQLRILEFPYASFAQSFAGTVPFSENIGFVRDPGDPEDNESVDLATYVTMHEIGHQWFGHQLTPARVQGFNVLSEGLTENAAMTAYEKKLGWQKARRVLDQRTIQRYLRERASDKEDEPPLAEAENQGYLAYAKASWVFWGMRQYIGDAKIQSAVRNFLQDNHFGGPPYPTTKELTDYLREAAGPDYQQLITDYWDRITLWDLKISDEDVKITSNDDGTFKVMLNITVDKKIAASETGKETSVKDLDGENLNEWVEIGFYTQDPNDTLGDEWLALERIKVTAHESTVSFDVSARPSHILLDPRRLLIERNVKDNVKALPKKLASAE